MLHCDLHLQRDECPTQKTKNRCTLAGPRRGEKITISETWQLHVPGDQPFMPFIGRGGTGTGPARFGRRGRAGVRRGRANALRRKRTDYGWKCSPAREGEQGLIKHEWLHWYETRRRLRTTLISNQGSRSRRRGAGGIRLAQCGVAPKCLDLSCACGPCVGSKGVPPRSKAPEKSE